MPKDTLVGRWQTYQAGLPSGRILWPIELDRASRHTIWRMARPASPLPDSADVVVIGGGVIGTSAAFHLAEAGVDVVLVERGQLGGGSTSRAAGGSARSSPTR